MSDQPFIPPPGESLGFVSTDAEHSSVITVNFHEGEVLGKAPSDSESDIARFLRDTAKNSKKNNVKSIIVMTINDQNHVDWTHIAESEHHMALAALCLDDIKADLKSRIFSEEEEEG